MQLAGTSVRRTGQAVVFTLIGISPCLPKLCPSPCFTVPANRIGDTIYSAAELEIMKEVITLVVFAAFPSSISASDSRSITCWASVSSAWSPSSCSKALCTRR